MPVLLSYCLKLSVSLALVSLFYQLVLRKLTFYNWNRYYLLGHSLLSFFVAFIHISPVLQQKEWTNAHFVQWIPVLNGEEIVTQNSDGPGFFTAWNIVGLSLVVGMGIMFFRLLFQLISFNRLIKKTEFISVEGMKFYDVNDSIIPFSFGNSIFINRHLHSEEELEKIIRHEFVHIKQKHSIDIIWAEIICLLNWYNPLVWLLRASIRQNLEFIADNKVLQEGINKKEYQFLLLRVIGNSQYSIATQFNFSSLKKRIAMMNKTKSRRLNLVKFLFVLPLAVALLLAFRDREFENPIAIKNEHSNPSANVVVSSGLETQLADTIPSHTKKQGATTSKEDRIIKVTIQTEPIKAVSAVSVDGIATTTAPVSVRSNINTNINTNVNSNVSVTTSLARPSVTSTSIPVTTAVNSEIAVVVPVTVAGEYNHDVTGVAEILMIITKKTTQEELESYKRNLKDRGIELSFDELKYENGVLKKIKGSVKSKDSNSNFEEEKFGKIVISLVKKGERTYFEINVIVYKVTS